MRIAPGANIVLIECNSASTVDMFQGVVTAAKLAGVSVVSMSWGSGEFRRRRLLLRQRLHDVPRGTKELLSLLPRETWLAGRVSCLFTERARRRRNESLSRARMDRTEVRVRLV